MWFNNTLIHIHLYTTLHFFILHHHCLLTPLMPTTHHCKHTKNKTKLYFFILYILANLSITLAIHHDFLLLYSLLSIPSFLSCVLLCFSTPHTLFKQKQIFSSPTLYTDISSSTNDTKLAYRHAWQSKQQHHTKIMNFTPGGRPLCIDTGASSCISILRSDFLDLTPMSDTVLNGISSGLSIEGIGILHLKITTDNNEDVELHVRNSPLVPSIPMCLIRTQFITQQTNSPFDGFHIKGSHGLFTFSGFTKMVHNNNKTT